MGKKRKLPLNSPAFCTMQNTTGLHSVSDESRRNIFNAAAQAFNQDHEQVDATAWKRMANQLHSEIFFPVEMKGVDPEQTVVFFMADLRKLLPHIVEKSRTYAALIEAELEKQPNLCFDLILYNDEATGGNLLQADSKKKASLWYFAFKQISWLWCDAVWHPLCVVQHCDFEKIQGNFSAIVRQIVQNLLNQDLHLGVPVVLPRGHYLLRCELRFMISDLDSIRGAMSLKGSSAIRCCCFCRNAIKKNCGLEEFSDYFLDISSNNFEAFHDQTDADIWTAVDELHRLQPILTKAALKKKEIASGFNHNPDGLLLSRTARETLPPSAFLLDSMHIYWSNGICSWEINAIYEMWASTNTGNLDEFLQLDWNTSAIEHCSSSWRRSLGHSSNFEGNSYKGSSSNLQSFLPLFHYFLEGCFRDGQLKQQLESLRALRRVTMELRHLVKQNVFSTDDLQQLQKAHQKKVLEAYGMQHMKPKHHARYHLAKQLERIQCYVDCFAMEKKHKLYKSHIGLHRFDPFASGERNKKGEFSFLVIQQIWQHHVKALSTFNFSDTLLGQCHDDGHVAVLLGVDHVQVAAKLQFGGRHIAKGQVLLGAHPGIVEKAVQCENSFFLFIQVLEMDATSEFHSTWKAQGRAKLLPVSEAGRSPSWWLKTSYNTFLCLH